MFILATIVLLVLNANGIVVPSFVIIIGAILASIEFVFWVIAILLQRGILKAINKQDWK